MKLKYILSFAAVIAASLLPQQTNSQVEAEEEACKAYFSYPYIVTGRPFRALLTGDEVAEFHTTLFSGTTYRIAVGSASKNKANCLIFSVYDADRNLLFKSDNYGNSPYWDFSVEGYLDVIVEARLDEKIASSGFAVVLTGFKVNEDLALK